MITLIDGNWKFDIKIVCDFMGFYGVYLSIKLMCFKWFNGIGIHKTESVLLKTTYYVKASIWKELL